MAEYVKEQRTQLSKAITNRETGSKQLKGFVDNREDYLQLKRWINFHSSPIQRVIRFYEAGGNLTDGEIEEQFSEDLKNPILKKKIDDLKALANIFTVAQVKDILAQTRREPEFVETQEEEKKIGYDPGADIDMDKIYAYYISIGGKRTKGQLQTVCYNSKKAGGHYTDLEGNHLEMRHDSHGGKTSNEGESVSAWKLAQNSRVVGVGFHLTSTTYTAIFPNTDHSTKSTCNAQVEVKQTGNY